MTNVIGENLIVFCLKKKASFKMHLTYLVMFLPHKYKLFQNSLFISLLLLHTYLTNKQSERSHVDLLLCEQKPGYKRNWLRPDQKV